MIETLTASAYINLIIGVTGVIFFLLIPVRSGCAFKNTHFQESVHSAEVKVSGIVWLVSVFFSGFDLIMEVLTSRIKKLDLDFNISKCRIGRVAILVVSLLFGIEVALTSDYFNLFGNNIAASYRFGFCCMRVVWMVSLLFCLCSANPTIFTFKKTAILSVGAVIASCFSFYAATSQSIVILVLCVLANLLLLTIEGIIILVWIIQLGGVGMKFVNANVTTSLFFLAVYVIISLSTTSHSVFSSLNYYLTSDAESIIITASIYIYVICSMLLSIIPSYLKLFEAVSLKDYLLEKNKAYVSYISHELRTPLNTVFMGLKLLIDRIPANTTDPSEFTVRSTLMEIVYACEVALEILNDLLLFDKLQNGLVSLNKENVVVIDFITKCINMFTVQLRSKKLQLTLFGAKVSNIHDNDDAIAQSSPNTFYQQVSDALTNADKNSCNNCYPLLINDTVEADKGKLAQVLRNLLSNAIKFTPEGGDIHVSVNYVPFEVEDSNSHKSFRNTSLVDINANKNDMYAEKPTSTSKSKASHRVHPTVNIADDDSGSYTLPIVSNKYMSSHNSNKCSSSSNLSPLRPDPPGEKSESRKPSENDMKCSMTDMNINQDKASGVYNKRFGMLVIEVKDSGVGICPDDQKRLFKEIIQFKPDTLQDGGGSGLGLFITKGTVDLHGGKISVHSEGEGKGTMFRVEIPMTQLEYIPKADNPDIPILSSGKRRKASTSGKVNDYIRSLSSTRLYANESERSTSVSFSNVATESMSRQLSSKKLISSSKQRSKSLSGLNIDFISIRDDNGASSKVFDYSTAIGSLKKSVLVEENGVIESWNYQVGRTQSSDSLDAIQVAEVKDTNGSLSAKPISMATTKSLRFLIVDDSGLNRKMLRRLLEARGHRCDEACDGLVAVTIIKDKLYDDIALNSNSSSCETDEAMKNKSNAKSLISSSPTTAAIISGVDASSAIDCTYDAILMDFVMLAMNGPTATKQIHKLGYTGPIFGLTGNVDDKERDIFIAAGASHVFTKPIDITSIIAVLTDMGLLEVKASLQAESSVKLMKK